MKPALKYGITLPLLAALFVIAGAMVWLLSTASGAKCLVRGVSRFTPFTIAAKEVEGRVWGALRMKDLSVSWPGGTAEVREITLRWRPGLLVSGQFAADELSATGVTVRDNRTQSAVTPAFPWPMLSGPPRLLNVRIDRLSLRDLNYRRRDEAPTIIRSLFAILRISEGTLTARTFHLTTPQFRAEGSLAAGLISPYVELRGSLFPESSVASMDRFFAKASIRPGKVFAEAEGSVEISGMSGAAKTATLEANILIRENEVALTSMNGTALSGTVRGGARILWKGGITLEGTLEARGLNPAGVLPRLRGNLNLDIHGAFRSPPEGSAEGELSLHLLDSGVQGQTLTGAMEARLKQGHIYVDRFAFRGKGFELTASGEWEKRIDVAARLSDISHFVPEASGSVSARGVVRRVRGRISGEASAHGRGLALNGVKAASSNLSLRVEDREGSPVMVKASLRDVTFDILHLETVTLTASGMLRSDKLFDLSGALSASRGILRHRVGTVELKADLNRADISWTWRGESIAGKLSLILAGYGHIDAGFQLPLPARFPFAFNRGGPVDISVKGGIRETGTLSFLFPALVQESRGRLVPDVRIKGTLAAPEFEGSLLLDQGSAYIPSAGIHVAGMRLYVRIRDNRIDVDSLTAQSGPGVIKAKMVVIMDGWHLVRYSGSLTGERFQILYLPEISALCSPKLDFRGTSAKVAVRGEVTVSDLLITGPPKQAAVQPSEDVVIIGPGAPAEKPAPYGVDVRIKVVLGDHVSVKAAGVDAQLSGQLLLAAQSVREITGTGEFDVIKGSYRAHGVNLNITRGRVLFAGGPVNNPGLDFLALRTIGDVRAGVRIGGVLQKPVVSLYSEPSLPDADILSYMVLGHPLGQDKAQAQSLMAAAAVILSSGENASLRNELRRRLGIDTVEIQGGEGGISQSVVTVGKYLAPELYLSYGRSLETGGNLFRLRYEFSRHWELETKTGEGSAVDLYYTIRFD